MTAQHPSGIRQRRAPAKVSRVRLTNRAFSRTRPSAEVPFRSESFAPHQLAIWVPWDATSDRAALRPVVSGGAIVKRTLPAVAYSTVTDRVPLPTST